MKFGFMHFYPNFIYNCSKPLQNFQIKIKLVYIYIFFSSLLFLFKCISDFIPKINKKTYDY